MQTPRWPLGLKVMPVEMIMGTTSIREIASWMQALLSNNGNAVMSGFGITPSGSGSPIQYSVGSGILFLSGYWQSVPGVILSFNNNSDASNHRLDAIVGQYGTTTGTDSNNNIYDIDTFTITKVQGTPATPALLPTLGANQVLLGWIDLSPSAASTGNCTVNQPASIYSKTLSDLSTHINASILTAAVHGVQATSAGGTESSRLAQTDTNGNVGSAKALWDGSNVRRGVGTAGGANVNQVLIGDSTYGAAGRALQLQSANGSFYQGTNPGAAEASRAAITDGTYGRVGRAAISDQLYDGGGTPRGVGTPGSATANVIPITDGNAAVYAANNLLSGSTPLRMFRGVNVANSTAGSNSVSVTFSPAFSATPSVTATIHVGGLAGAAPGSYATAESASGATVGFWNNGNSQNTGVNYAAIGN